MQVKGTMGFWLGKVVKSGTGTGLTWTAASLVFR